MLPNRQSLIQLYDLDSVSTGIDGIAEPEEPVARDVPEKLVSCLWFDPRWRPLVFATLDGRSFSVRSPGQWNRQAGPDFRQAVIEYADGEVCRGDVEVHRVASGWTAHRHHMDARYNDVILHVILHNDRTATEIIRADGQAVPQVVLTDWLSRPIAAYRAEISLEDYPSQHAPRIGQCYTALRALPAEEIQHFLRRAGEVRLRQRAVRWSKRVEDVGLSQTLYEAILRSLGATGYRQPFQALARILPWQDAQECLEAIPETDRQMVAEALFLGMAGMLDAAQAHAKDFDTETQTYLDTLSQYWQELPCEITRRGWTQASWRSPHIRPANTPERRLAGMAQLVARYRETDLTQSSIALLDTFRGETELRPMRALGKGFSELFDTPETSYWSCRSRFGARPARVQRLIGRQRASTLVIDALLPLLLLQAQTVGESSQELTLLVYFRAAPKLPDNSVIQDMKRRLLGEDPALLPLVTRACHQQGLLQVFEDYCSHDEGDCQGCDFPQLLG